MDTVIWIQETAPRKPAVGDACNGCGVCCHLEPCPVGMVLSLRVRGACRAVRWDAGAERYVCGALTASASLRRPMRWLHRWLQRRIGAGAGCDCTVESAAMAPTGFGLRPAATAPPPAHAAAPPATRPPGAG